MRRLNIRLRAGSIWIPGLLFAFLSLLQPVARAAGELPRLACPCTLAWDSSPAPGIAGFALYYGLAGASTTNRLDVGTARVATIYSLSASSNYLFYAVSYDTNGIESLPSNVVFYRPPALSPLQLTKLSDGTMRVRCSAATGSVCRIEHSPTLSPPQWQTLSTTTADLNGQAIVDDPTTNRPPTRFYRAVLP